MRELQTDRELARKAATGDSPSWRQIFEATSDRLFSFLVFQTGDREEARDLLQMTYVAAFKHIAAFRGEAPLEVWLRRIALRQAIDWKRSWLRKVRRTVPLGDAHNQLEDVSNPPPGEDVRFESERVALRRALDRLSGKQRAVLLLREWEERTFAEIAEVVGCNESTARVHYVRACRRMRSLLDAGTVPIGLEEWEGTRI